MSVKISIFKSSADGEQTNIEYTLEAKDYKQLEPIKEIVKRDGQTWVVEKPTKTLFDLFRPYFRMVDDRLLEMNLRIMVANNMVRKLPPEAQVAIHSVMESMHGQRPTLPEFSEMLRATLAEVTERVISQGVNPERVKQAVENSYPNLTLEPKPEESQIEPSEAPQS